MFQYLKSNDKIEDITDYNEQNLHISTDHVLEMIQAGEDGWELMVPANVAQQIKENCLIGYPCEVEYTPISVQIKQAVEQGELPSGQQNPLLSPATTGVGAQ